MPRRNDTSRRPLTMLRVRPTMLALRVALVSSAAGWPFTISPDSPALETSTLPTSRVMPIRCRPLRLPVRMDESLTVVARDELSICVKNSPSPDTPLENSQRIHRESSAAGYCNRRHHQQEFPAIEPRRGFGHLLEVEVVQDIDAKRGDGQRVNGEVDSGHQRGNDVLCHIAGDERHAAILEPGCD